MKRNRFILFFILTAALLLSACQKPLEGDPFVRFRENFDARFELECNGVSSVLVCEKDDDGLSLTFEAPETLKGYVFTCVGEECSLSFEDVTVSLTPDLARVPNIIKEILASTSDQISSITGESSESGTMTRVSANGISYLFRSDGTPESAEGVILGAEVKLKINEINFNTPEGEQ